MIDNVKNKRKKIRYFEKLAKQIKINITSGKRPLIVEFSGVPKAGKTTVVNSLALFLRRNDIETIIITERASVCPIKNKHHPFFNIWTSCITLTNIITHIKSNEYLVIIIDRGIFDSLIWMNLLCKKGKLKDDELKIIEEFLLLPRWNSSLDLVIYMRTSVENALNREFKDLFTEKQGSIMNKDFLRDFTHVANEVKEKYKNHFHKILEIDTTDTETLKGVEKVTSEVINSLLDLSDNQLLVIPKKEFIKRLNFTGFDGDTNKFKILQRVISNNSERKRRSDAEINDDYIQIVPCAIITYENKIIYFTKREVSQDKRFHNKSMIWVGGHLLFDDINQYEDITIRQSLVNCLLRELEEELEFATNINPIFKGLVYDKSSQRSIQHLGVVFLIDIKDKLVHNSLDNRTFRELSGQEIDTESIPLSQDYFNEKIESIEPWSKDILKSLFKINVALPKDKQQLLLF